MLYTSVDNALRNQLQTAVPKVYISAILYPIIGIGNTTCLTLLTHLHDTYGTITEAELDRNLDRMKIQWKPPTSIELLFTQISDGVELTTAGGDPPTGPSIIRIAYNIIATTGRFDIATREWRAKTVAQKTWATFQLHFKAADTDNHLLQTSGTAGYHGASNMTITLANTQSALGASELALSLALQAHVSPSITSSANISDVTNTTSSTPARTYCWTHDITTNLSHTSSTCSTKIPGNQDDATENNKMGGTTFVCRHRTRARERGPVKGHYNSVATNVKIT
jgi:hypothetical protein